MNRKQKNTKQGAQHLSNTDRAMSTQKNTEKTSASPQDKKKHKPSTKAEVAKPVSQNVKEKMPDKKNLGPSGQQWDI